MIAAALGIRTREPDAPALEVVDGLDGLQAEWERLAAESRNVFATWEWSELWWRHYGGGRERRVAVFRGHDGEAEALVPLFLWSRRPLRTLRLIGHGHGDRLGPICRQDDPEVAARSLRAALAVEPHDLFVGDWVAGDLRWAQVLGGRALRRTGYPILRLDEDSWDGFLAKRSTRFRKSLRHARNRLERARDVRFRLAAHATLERDLSAVFRLHRARFGAHPCNFCGEHEAFQREFAALALERGWLRLLLLEVDGSPVACDYGFLFAGAHFAYQSGRDPAWNEQSVGSLVEVESIRRALEQGASEYRFLGGEEGYKYRYPTEDPGLETVVAPATRRGRLASEALAGLWRLPGGQALLRRVGSA